MMKEIIIEDLRGLGMTAKLIDAGKQFTTYNVFASKAGYPDAVSKGFNGSEKSEALRERSNDVFKVLARGNHGGKYYSDVVVYVIESEDGERFLVGDNGLEIEHAKELSEMNSDELSEHISEAIKELRSKSYGEGYEQGKFDAELDSIEGRAKKRKEDFAERRQERRDRIIEKAKKDVEGLRRTGTAFGRSFEYRENLDGHSHFGEGSGDAYNGKFIVNKEKRTVVVLLIGWSSGKIRKRGIAKAHPNDCFNVHIGKAIALRRALGLEVPDEYLNAPQPTEVRVGDKIRMKYYNPVGERPDSYYVRIINGFVDDEVRYEEGGFDFRKNVDKDAKIIDDSREEEREEVSE